jgi:lambda family phage tail tape measure protein
MATNVAINVAVTSTGAQQVTVQLQGIGQAANQSATQVDGLTKAIASIGFGAALAQLQQYIDAWSNAEGMIRTATTSMAQAAAVQQQLFDIAQSTRQPLSDITSLYQKLAIQSDALGLSQNQVLTITQELGEALVIQHTSASQAAGALLQFSQALSTGKVRAQEWNSILTGLPVLAKAVADQLGVATSQVKQMMTAGTLNSAGLAQAVLGAQATLAAQFATSAHTISQSFTVLNNAATKWIGQAADSVNASNLFGTAMTALAANFDTVAKSVIALNVTYAAFILLNGGLAVAIDAVTASLLTMLAAILANPFVAIAAAVIGTVTALYEFRDAITVSSEAGTTLGDYFTGTWGLIKQGAEQATTAVGSFLDQTTGLGIIWDDIKANAITAFNALKTLIPTVLNYIIGYFVGFYNSVTIIWNNFPAYFLGLFTQAFNGVIQLAGTFTNSMISLVNTIGDKVDFHVDPVQFSGIENQFSSVTDSIAKNFQNAFNVDYVGKFVAAVNSAAQGVANVRKLASRQGGGGDAGSMDAHGAPAQIVDPNAAKKLQELQNQLRGVLNTIDPAGGAVLDMERDTTILSQSLAKGLLGPGQQGLDAFAKDLAALALHYKDQLDPQAAYIANLTKETQILSEDGDARQIATAIYQQQQDAQKKGQVLTQQQIAQDTQALQLNITANQVAQQRQTILSTTVDTITTFVNAITAADQLLASHTITLDQYKDAIDGINKALLDTQKTLSAGVGSGLIEIFQDTQNIAESSKAVVVDAFNGMNDALVNFVTTGKLNFTDLVNSIMSDLAKLYLKIIENQVLTNFFGTGTGLSTAGGSLLGSIGYASGGYTGDGGAGDIAGVVHKGEVVINAGVVSQPGMKDYLTAINAGASPSSSSGGTSVGVTAQTQINVQVTNNAADKVSASVQKGTDAQGNASLSVIIDSVESELAGRVGSGRGKLYKSIGNAYGLKSVPARS